MKYVSGLRSWFFSLSKTLQVILIIIVIGTLSFVGNTYRNSTTSNAVTYRTTKAEKGSVIRTITVSGNVSSSQVNVTSPTTGVLQETYVKNGDKVVAGQRLFKVQSTASAQEKAAALASYQTAVNALATAKSNLQSLDSSMWSAQKALIDAQNTQNVLNDGAHGTNPATKESYTDLERRSVASALIQSQKAFSAAEQKYKDASLAVSAAQASFASAKMEYDATKTSVVVAPISSTVANFSGNIGTVVTASSTSTTTTTTGSTVLVLGDFSRMQIKVLVSEVDMPSLKVGQKATITADALPDITMVGTVDSLDTIGTNSSGVVTYAAYVTLLSPPPELQTGMTSSVIIQTKRKDDVIKVPSTAVQTINGTPSIKVMVNGVVTTKTVETGLSSDSETEIISGISEGDDVVTSTITTKKATSTSVSPFSGLGGAARGGGGFPGR